jgi:hypothetical protein
VENFVHLVNEALPVVHRCTDKAILPLQNLLPAQCSIKVLLQKLHWLVFPPIQEQLHGVLEINIDFVAVDVLLRRHVEAIIDLVSTCGWVEKSRRGFKVIDVGRGFHFNSKFS